MRLAPAALLCKRVLLLALSNREPFAESLSEIVTGFGSSRLATGVLSQSKQTTHPGDNFRYLTCIRTCVKGFSSMTEPQLTAVAIQPESTRTPAFNFIQSSTLVVERVGAWAGDTAQQFGVLVAVLMAPAVFSVYAFAVWALASNLGFTDTFIFTSGALSNWLIWLALAVMVHMAATVLKRHTRLDR